MFHTSHFACCLGDTMASELGILAPTQPWLITSFKPVPAGTNGGISVSGTAASLIGGVIMGLTLSATVLFECTSCRGNTLSLILDMLVRGGAAGLLGSLVRTVFLDQRHDYWEYLCYLDCRSIHSSELRCKSQDSPQKASAYSLTARQARRMRP